MSLEDETDLVFACEAMQGLREKIVDASQDAAPILASYFANVKSEEDFSLDADTVQLKHQQWMMSWQFDFKPNVELETHFVKCLDEMDQYRADLV